jgi:curved DNA-binding protein
VNWKQFSRANQGWQGWPGAGQQTYTYDFSGGGFDFGDIGSGFSDFFEMFFGRGSDERFSSFFGNTGGTTTGTRGQSKQARRNFWGTGNAQKGQDWQYDLNITLREAYFGTQRVMSFQKGGKVRTVNIKVPKGIKNGAKIRVKGEGSPGTRGGESGDLYLVVNIMPHHYFTVKGSDLYCEVPVTIKEAIMGAKIDIPTFQGKISMTLPPNTQSEKTLRLKGKGMPKIRSTEYGDLYVKIKVIIPSSLTEEQKKHFENFAKVYHENPRQNITV